MASCEYCWERRHDYAVNGDPVAGYYRAMGTAEEEGWPCTTPTEEGARLRAGQYWDAERKVDTRLAGASNAE
jgi:hypothetical protein